MGQEWWGYERTTPRPVKDGIRARSRRGAIGERWWSRQWVQALERFASHGRLERGRSYARRGQVAELDVGPRGVRARVQGSRPQPYEVTIRLKPLRDAAWDRVFSALAAEAGFAASLLAGEVPQDIERAFEAAGQRLFPAGEEDLETDCSCPDWENPCKHVAAVHYLLAEAFDRDPFLLLQLRGRSREQVLEALRGRRAIRALKPAGRASPPQDPAARAAERSFWSASPGFTGLDVRIEPPAADAVLLEAHGFPPAWRGGAERQLLADVYRRASAWAIRAAVGEGGEADTNAASAPRRPLAPGRGARPAERGAAPRRAAPKRPPEDHPLPLGVRRVHASGNIMVRRALLPVGKEHAGADVQVYEDAGRIRVRLPDGQDAVFGV